jgi:hypothetical protein
VKTHPSLSPLNIRVVGALSEESVSFLTNRLLRIFTSSELRAGLTDSTLVRLMQFAIRRRDRSLVSRIVPYLDFTVSCVYERSICWVDWLLEEGIFEQSIAWGLDLKVYTDPIVCMLLNESGNPPSENDDGIPPKWYRIFVYLRENGWLHSVSFVLTTRDTVMKRGCIVTECRTELIETLVDVLLPQEESKSWIDKSVVRGSYEIYRYLRPIVDPSLSATERLINNFAHGEFCDELATHLVEIEGAYLQASFDFLIEIAANTSNPYDAVAFLIRMGMSIATPQVFEAFIVLLMKGLPDTCDLLIEKGFERR